MRCWPTVIPRSTPAPARSGDRTCRALDGRLDEAVQRLTVAVECVYDTHAWVWLSFSALRLVETLLQRGQRDDTATAYAAADRFAGVAALDGRVAKHMTLDRMHALIGHARGDARAIGLTATATGRRRPCWASRATGLA